MLHLTEIRRHLLMIYWMRWLGLFYYALMAIPSLGAMFMLWALDQCSILLECVARLLDLPADARHQTPEGTCLEDRAGQRDPSPHAWRKISDQSAQFGGLT
ncbi:hypothetical protein ACEUZ9_001133 [Paracoccus litorisediminis]|uniref:hypothetical protein n=1 Tax=Paracoccus litorisediminis TaxID=2006130 RepID=UPI00373188A7